MCNRNKIPDLCILLITFLLCSSCGKDLIIPYTNDSTINTHLLIKPEKPTNKTFISINDSLIVKKKFIKSLKIENLPEGIYKINYLSDVNTTVSQLDTTITVNILKERKLIQTIKVPPHNSWYYISNILIGLVLIIPFTFL